MANVENFRHLQIVFSAYSIRKKKTGSKIKLNEWKACLDWKLEDSMRNTD